MLRKNNLLLEDGDVIYSEAQARELLNAQNNYNKGLKELNDKLAQQREAINVKYMKIAQQQTAAAKSTTTPATKNVSQATQQTAKQTGTVTTAGQPVSSNGNVAAATVESYPDILNIKELNEVDEPWLLRPGGEEARYTGNINADQRDQSNWTERPVTGGHPEKKEPQRRVKKMTWAIREKIMDLEGEIEDEKQNLRYYEDATESPDGAQGETEEFFAEIGEKASEILNSGGYKDEGEVLRALQKAGVPNAEDILHNYYYYYPEFNPALDAKRKEAAKEIPKIQAKIDKLQAKIDKMETVYESVNENKFTLEDVDPYDLQELKDYLDAENISYTEDEDGSTIDFDETELDKEWKDRIDSIGMKLSAPEETSDILSMDDDDTESGDITDKDEKIDNDKVFYVKVDDEGEEFVGKIYKLFDEGDWRSKLVDGVSDTFEKMNYDPDWDEVDIIAFLRENYADAELMSEEEFNNHAEEPEAEPENTNESTKLEPNLGGKIDPKTHKLLKKDQNKNDRELDGVEKELTEHKIPTLDEFMNEKQKQGN